MFDLSLTEILIVVVVCVVFITPKDLPVVMRAIAKLLANLRGMARELKGAFDDLAKESGITETQDAINREVRMITGDDGKKYESYDIADFLPGDGKPRITPEP